MLALLAARFIVAMALAVLATMLGMHDGALWTGLLALACSGLVVDAWLVRPAARRWLRQHAHELDRYVTP
jgi:hypothetical protein